MAGGATARGSAWRRPVGVVVLLVLVVAAAALGWWASRATLTSAVPQDTEPGGESTVVWGEASAGSVGRALPLSTTLRQPAVPVSQNTLAGVVTQVSPGEVDQGEVVYVVGDTPVRVVQADRPFWRDLARGAEGEDVAALQELLGAEGHLATDPDGTFGAATHEAVRAWQAERGRERTGVVGLGGR